MRLPGNTERLTIYGMTGTGKTNAALWHLSQRNFDSMPWVVFDFKGDSAIGALEGTRALKTARVPDDAGIWIARPIPKKDDEWVEDLLWMIHARGDTGVYIDEGYMIGARSEALNALLTQGRSKRIPMIVLSQRPVWLSRFVISEAEFHQVFFLSDEADRDIVQRFIPHDISSKRLPRFHSWYYDVANDDFNGLQPLPAPGIIRDRINERLEEFNENGPEFHYELARPHRFI
jgi:hypothetical protein